MQKIELFGLPGAGKTTCANQAINNAKKNGLEIFGRTDFNKLYFSMSKIEKLFIVTNHLSIYLAYIKPFSKGIHRNLFSGKEFWRRVILSPLDYIFTDIFFSKNYGIYLSDQGFIQWVWSIMVRSRQVSYGSIKTMCAGLSHRRDTAFVYLKIDPEKAAQRVFSRHDGNSVFDGTPYDQVRADFITYNSYFEFIVSQMELNGIAVRHIDATSNIDDCVSTLLSIVTNEKQSLQVGLS